MKTSPGKKNWTFLAAGLLLVMMLPLSLLRVSSHTVFDEPKNTYRAFVVALLKRDVAQLDWLSTPNGRKRIIERMGDYHQLDRSRRLRDNWRDFGLQIAERRIAHWQVESNGIVGAIQEEKDALFWSFTFKAIKSGWRLDNLYDTSSTYVSE